MDAKSLAATTGSLTTAGLALMQAAGGVSGEVLIPVSVVAGLVAGAVGYGALRQTAKAAHRRLDEHDKKFEADAASIDRRFDAHERSLDRRFAELNGNLSRVTDTLGDLRVLVARIAPDRE